MQPGFAALALCDRAFRFLAERGVAAEPELLAHVYGGPIPGALQPRLATPLLADARLERRADGTWSVRGAVSAPPVLAAFTALALAATGPSPSRARLVQVVALHVEAEQVIERFDVLLKPPTRVPQYVLDRLGLEPEILEQQAAFADVVDALERFLGARPILAQDARLTWAFVEAEARRLGRILVEPELLDLNRLSSQLLASKRKPSLAMVATELGVPVVDVKRPEEEARVVAAVGARLLAMGIQAAGPPPDSHALQRGSTARGLPDEPGVYVMRDAEQTPLYVGKAGRLRLRMAAYVHRPLGATRRLEGLVSSVDAVDTTHCDTDLEALVLEDREIRRLQPRFNTVRQQRSPRYWIRLPPQRVSARGRPLAPPRLELSRGPGDGDGAVNADFMGPFRNEATAQLARRLAREVFELDALRRRDVRRYLERLGQAWAFLHGDTELAQRLARRSVPLLRRVVAFDVSRLLLPADPRLARYAVVRPAPSGIEGFVLDRAVLVAWSLLEDDDTFSFARALLSPSAPRTTAADVDVVLRWFGAQRASARLVHLPDDEVAAADAIEIAALELLEARAASRQDAFDPLG